MSTYRYSVAAGIRRGYAQMKKDSEFPCACGGLKKFGYVVCLACWMAASQALRDQYQSLGTRRAGTAALKRFAAKRNSNRDKQDGQDVKTPTPNPANPVHPCSSTLPAAPSASNSPVREDGHAPVRTGQTEEKL